MKKPHIGTSSSAPKEGAKAIKQSPSLLDQSPSEAYIQATSTSQLFMGPKNSKKVYPPNVQSFNIATKSSTTCLIVGAVIIEMKNQSLHPYISIEGFLHFMNLLVENMS